MLLLSQAIEAMDQYRVGSGRLLVTRAQNKRNAPNPRYGVAFPVDPLLEAGGFGNGYQLALPVQSPHPRRSSINVYVKNLALHVDEDVLGEQFAQFGDVLNVKVCQLHFTLIQVHDMSGGARRNGHISRFRLSQLRHGRRGRCCSGGYEWSTVLRASHLRRPVSSQQRRTPSATSLPRWS